jgi:hypothetical protein
MWDFPQRTKNAEWNIDLQAQSLDLDFGSSQAIFVIRSKVNFEFFRKEVDFNFIAAQVA